MTFLHPALLAAGLGAIAIPIIIHLLMHRRRKPVMWGAMRFLLEAYKRQRRKLMVEKWLLLACRCLVLAMLACAIGRPLLGVLGAGSSGRTVYLVIDNALAAQTRDADGKAALERHKAAAKSVLEALRAGTGAESDRVGLIALGAPAETIVVPASANLGSISGLIDAIQPADGKADFAGAFGAIASALAPKDGSSAARPDHTFVVVLSDFLEGSLDPTPGAEGATGGAAGLGGVKLPAGVRLIAMTPNSAAPSNVGIVGLDPLRSVLVEPSASALAGESELTELVRVQLRRTGPIVGQAATTTVRARLAFAGSADAGTESPTERATVRWSAGQESATAIVPIRTDRRGPRAAAGATGGSASLGTGLIVASIDDDALSTDNRARRPVELRDALRVGIVAPLRFARPDRIDKLEPAAWAKLALAPAGQRTGVDAVDIEPASLDAARLAGLDAVVLPRPDLVPESAWPRLKLFIESGGLVIVAPPPGVTVHLWGDAMARGLGLDFAPAREAIDLTTAAGPGKLARTQTTGESAPNDANTPQLLSLVEGELDELVTGVSVLRLLPLQPAPERGERVLTLDDGKGIVMWAGTPGDGKPAAASGTPKNSDARGLLVYLGVALDLEWSDLPARPLMVPLMQEILRQGVSRARGSWSALAGQRPAMPARTGELQEVADPAKSGENADTLARLRVDASGSLVEPIRRAGVFRAIDDRGSTRGIVAINPDPRAGRTTAQTTESVAGLLKSTLTSGADSADALLWIPPSGTASGVPGTTAGAPGDTVGAMSAIFGRTDRGSPLALPMLIAALALAIIEVVLARRSSHAELSDSGPIISPSSQSQPQMEAA